MTHAAAPGESVRIAVPPPPLRAVAPCAVVRRIDAPGWHAEAWMRTKRIEAALLELGDGAAPPLAELAGAAGFADQAHMAREFRSVLAATPRDVRATWRQGDAARWSLEPAHGRFLQDGEPPAS